MCLCCGEAGVNIICVSTKSGLGLSADERVIQTIDERSDSWREGRATRACEAIILDDPEAVPIRVG